ncbi:TenA/THI-4 protein [Nostoc carneum NIES-2107]|nr:TenA/THI-4 protein [Nostoc carneum NIES-2107]
MSSLETNYFREITVNHPLWNHHFLTRCRTGNLSLPDVQVLEHRFSNQIEVEAGSVV